MKTENFDSAQSVPVLCALGWSGMVMDPMGRRVLEPHEWDQAKTKLDHPYNYNPILQYRNRKSLEATGTVYTDRLLRWDHHLHDELCEKHFGNCRQYWSDRSPATIKAFLRDWMSDPTLELVQVIEYCDMSSGYPCWRLDYAQAIKARDSETFCQALEV